jgi:vesicle coat complex subunit
MAGPALTAALKDDDRNVQAYAALSLWQIDRQTELSTSVLRRLLTSGPMLNDKGLWIDTAHAPAAYALSLIDPRSGFPALCKIIQDMQEDRLSAISLAASLGPRAKPAVPTITQALKDRASRIRLAAAQALGAIGREAEYSVPSLVEAAKESNPQVSRAAVQALRSIDASGWRAKLGAENSSRK